MKHLIAGLLLICLLWTGAAAEVTLKAVNTFSGTDAAVETYLELLTAWEDATGNMVNNESVRSDEAFKTSVLNDFAAGNEPDILFYFAGGADSAPLLDKLVPIEEINAAYPGLNLPVEPMLTEVDGKVYAIPVRTFWEALLVNVDLFEQYGLELPADWEKLEKAIKVFRANGIVPIAISLSDIPHYIIEMAILACGTPEEHQLRPKPGEPIPESWIEGMKLIQHLYELGAFPPDVNATTEAVTSAMFLNKRAAMQLDGSWFANGIPEERWNSIIAMPFPAYSEDADPTAIIGGVSMGFFLSRRAWDDHEKRDAAVSLLAYLTTSEHAEALSAFIYGGKLLKSSEAMLANANVICPTIQDDMDLDIRNVHWFEKIPGIADATEDPEAILRSVIDANPFISNQALD